jgi:endonuclease YncB( thermonuclease family)
MKWTLNILGQVILGFILMLRLVSCTGCSRTPGEDRARIRSRPSENEQKVGEPSKSTIPIFTVLPRPIEAEVVGIQDGDTIELKAVYEGNDAKERSGKNIRIRFLHVNCPERGKPFYQIAKQFTSEACFRQVVRIVHEGEFDRYGRLLGEVILSNGDTLNRELVKSGLAVHFKKYSDDQEYAYL